VLDADGQQRPSGRYSWFATYADTQGGRWIRIMTIASLLGGGVAFIATLFTPAGPHSPLGRTVTVAAALVGMCTAVAWMGPRWPRQRHSAICIVIVSVATSTCFLTGTQPLVALLLSAASAAVCGYVSMFHSIGLLGAVWTITLGATAILYIQALAYDPVLASIELSFAVMIILGGPAGTRWWIATLGVDVRNSDTDFLTGLLNRRGFYLGTAALVDAHRGDTEHQLALVLVDLDGFKKLNDTNGHLHGDRALIAISSAIRGQTRRHAVVARTGGDEFLIADVVDSGYKALVLAGRLCSAINAMPQRLTASIGLSSMAIASLRDGADDKIEQLIADADAAMYRAKRAGGNQFQFNTPDQDG